MKKLQRVLVAALLIGASSSALAADDGTWSVSKSSGEVWVTATGAAPASLAPEEILKPGDTIRTGRNGRVLLVRGEETMLIAPNSVVGLPTAARDGMSTTVLQQAGSILLEVERRNVKHFEVETPYLAAVVKGTQFTVTVKADSTSVSVNRGLVEVSDFKSGQIAQVLPGQAATSFTHGKAGLSLSGSGAFNPIEQGRPRASGIERVPVPKGGLTAPRSAGDGKSIHALKAVDPTSSKLAAVPSKPASTEAPIKRSGVRISTALGEVRLNVQKATRGLAHGMVKPGAVRSASNKDSASVWSDPKASTSGVVNSNVTGNTAASPATAVNGVTSAAAATASASASNNNGNGASGNGKTNNGNGNNGNGNSGNGNNGNGNNGNGNNGNNGNGNNGNNGNGNNGNGNNGNGNNGNHNGNGKKS
ncbi:MAG: FecR domain-containing protein [Bradyrhizobium sp.]|uniref:FecR family protein n=1 Tax=Bradyrhizobium sp. TaxID=376 RepID=UPI001DEF0C13|nr:FecR family protein [Bradyrhizobium sp.]MBV9559632.1 FecR domain-containing protein [Bradyrhizobium sp.]